MAYESLKAFVDKIKTDESLQKELMALAAKKDMDATATFLKEKGVSEEDVEAFTKLQDNLTTVKDAELDDETLEMVAGGDCWSDVAAICWVGYEADNEDICVLAYVFH